MMAEPNYLEAMAEAKRDWDRYLLRQRGRRCKRTAADLYCPVIELGASHACGERVTRRGLCSRHYNQWWAREQKKKATGGSVSPG